MNLPDITSPESLLPPKDRMDGPISAYKLEGEGVEVAPYVEEEMFRDIAAELAYSDVESELKSAVVASSAELSGVEEFDVSDEVLEREKAFFTKVFASTLSMGEKQDGPVTLLFDLDQTLIHNDLVRPSFPLLIKELHDVLGERLEVGVLSSRRPQADGDEDLKDKLVEPIAEVTELRPTLNRDFVISSGHIERSSEYIQGLVYGDDTESQIKAIEDILDPDVVDAIRAGAVNTREFYDTKLIVLDQLVSNHPDRGFVIIDDFPHAGVVDRDDLQASGVCVREEMLESIFKPYTNKDAQDTPDLAAA